MELNLHLILDQSFPTQGNQDGLPFRIPFKKAPAVYLQGVLEAYSPLQGLLHRYSQGLTHPSSVLPMNEHDISSLEYEHWPFLPYTEHHRQVLLENPLFGWPRLYELCISS